MVGLDRRDDPALGHLVEVVAIARVGGRQLPRRAAAERVAGGERRKRAQQQRLADVLAVGAGEDHRDRRLAEPRLVLQPVAQHRRRRRLVPERLHHPHDAVTVTGRPDQGRQHPVLAEHALAEREERVARRHPVLDQLLEQPVVELEPGHGGVPRGGRFRVTGAGGCRDRRFREAMPGWAGMPAAERGELLHEVATRLRDRTDELARVMTLEGGKPLIENSDEVGWTAACFDFYAELGRAPPAG